MDSGAKEKYTRSIESLYASSRSQSQKLHLEACRYLPGGDTRTATFFDPFPHYIQRGARIEEALTEMKPVIKEVAPELVV